MAKKLGGYLLMLIGIFLMSLVTEPVRKLIQIKIPAEVTDLYLIIGGAVLVLFGIIFAKSKNLKSMKGIEVPIFQGKNVVGYRRN